MDAMEKSFRQLLLDNEERPRRRWACETAPMTRTAPADTTSDSGDHHDRVLIRGMLQLTPLERLRTVAAYWPMVRLGLERRAAAGGNARP